MSGASAQTYARIAGVLFLISIVAGGFGEFYVPSTLIVSADATATANNIRASEWLFRLGFAGYLVEALCDIGLTLVLYVLLRRVHEELALLAAFFRLVSTAVFAAAEPMWPRHRRCHADISSHFRTSMPFTSSQTVIGSAARIIGRRRREEAQAGARTRRKFRTTNPRPPSAIRAPRILGK